MKRLKDVLIYTGFILTGISAVAYLILLYVLIVGFNKTIDPSALFVFLLIGAIDGLLISLSLRIQGIDLAKNEETSKAILKEYRDLTSKKKDFKEKPMWQFQLINLAKDIIVKSGTVLFSLYFTVSIIIEGMGDFTVFFLGIVNVMLYLGFGLLSLAKAYEFYLEHRIPAIQNKINKLKEEQNGSIKEISGGETKQSDDSRRDQGSEDIGTEPQIFRGEPVEASANT